MWSKLPFIVDYVCQTLLHNSAWILWKDDEAFRQWLLKLDESMMWNGNIYRNKGIPYCWNVKHKKNAYHAKL